MTDMEAELFHNAESELHGLLNHFIPGLWTCAIPGMMTITDRGLGFLYHDESTLRIGFGVLSGLTPSPEMLVKIGEINRLNESAHAWLVPDIDKHWSAVVGLKIPYLWLTQHTMQQFMYTTLISHDALFDLALGMLQPFGGYPHWDPTVSVKNYAKVLAAHLM